MATFIQSFPFTGADQTFTVPAGVDSIKIQTWGAGGGGSQAPGGAQSAGGAGGVNPYNGGFNGSAGSAFQGGDGGFSTTLGSGAGGGGGYFGGGGGAGELATAAPLSTDAGGGGGSSYIGGVTSGLTLCTPQNTSPNVGNPQFPPNTTDPNYIAGVGVGNSLRGTGAGGNGLVVITFDVVPDSIPVTKKVSKTTAKVGDVLTYTLTIPNNTPYPASNVVITDPIPAGTSYVAGSTSASVAFTGDPTTTINLTNPIAVGQTVTITYQVTVDVLPTPNPIPNTATMDYSVTPVVGAPPIDVTATSNTVTTLVFEPSRGVEFI